MSEKRYIHKIAILGTPRSGKTTLGVKLAKGIFEESIKTTIGVDFHLITREKPEGKLIFWDLAGQTHYRTAGIFDDMVHGASAFIFCYDASDASSIQEIDNWVTVAKRHTKFDKTKKYLVGLKGDLVDNAQQIGLTKLVQKYLLGYEYNLKHFIVSSKTDMNIDIFLAELEDDLAKLLKP